MNRRHSIVGLAILAAVATLAPSTASAFCGFYVGGADAGLTNNATLVVMMREGTRTVLSMQNDYQGPPEGFAMVVPVPQVLQEENVQTLPREVFAHVDQLSSPRLVEYWETDPCWVEPEYPEEEEGARDEAPTATATGAPDDLGVTIEAQFEVGEYEIVILSASDSDGLETWLQREEYNIPDGASDVLRPYIEAGTKFFVAKVNPERVTFEDGRAVLSPLRVHYDSDAFNLPVRLGLLNSSGTQELIVHILARDQRYEVANYENVTIPTNLDVADEVRDDFGRFYTRLFDLTLERNPGAVVTEYAWQATNCDPCPGPVLSSEDLYTLGADVAVPPGERDPWALQSFVLTRLHYRYGADGLDEDLVFREANAIVGGREFLNGETLEHGARESSVNNFQARYAIRHPWEGAINCDNPIRGRWGGPPSGGANQPRAAEDLAFAERPETEVELPPLLRTSAPEIGVEAGLEPIATILAQTPVPSRDDDDLVPGQPSADDDDSGCGSCAARPGRVPYGLIALLGVALAFGIVRRRGGR